MLGRDIGFPEQEPLNMVFSKMVNANLLTLNPLLCSKFLPRPPLLPFTYTTGVLAIEQVLFCVLTLSVLGVNVLTVGKKRVSHIPSQEP